LVYGLIDTDGIPHLLTAKRVHGADTLFDLGFIAANRLMLFAARIVAVAVEGTGVAIFTLALLALTIAAIVGAGNLAFARIGAFVPSLTGATLGSATVAPTLLSGPI